MSLHRVSLLVFAVSLLLLLAEFFIAIFDRIADVLVEPAERSAFLIVIQQLVVGIEDLLVMAKSFGQAESLIDQDLLEQRSLTVFLEISDQQA